LAGASPQEATNAFIDRFRSTLSCLVNGVAIGSGFALGGPHSVTLYVTGQDDPNTARLPTHDGNGEILFRFAHQYRIERFEDPPDTPEEQRRGPFKARSAYYRYDILDRTEQEIVVFHWEPDGRRRWRRRPSPFRSAQDQ